MIPFRNHARALFLSTAGTIQKKLSSGIHILNGHGLSINQTDVGVAKFLELLRKLRNVSEFIRIEDAAEAILDGSERNGVYIAFTFDDGYLECYTDIAPILTEFGTNAAFFVNPGFIDGDFDYQQSLFLNRLPDMSPRAPMTRKMVRELATNGFVIGAHTYDHVRLVGLTPSEIQQQIVQCRRTIEDVTGVPCDHFAWTYGKYSDIDQASLDAALATYRYVYSSDRYWESTSMNNVVLNRRHFECEWPFSHVNYFLGRPRKHFSSDSNL